LMLALFYFLAAGSDPTPETTWSTFYREMLSTGEVLVHSGQNAFLVNSIYVTGQNYFNLV